MKPILLSLIAGAIAVGALLGQSPAWSIDVREELGHAGPLPQPPGGDRAEELFTSVDIVIDPAGKPLAAYQLDFKARDGRVKIVGVEGGEHAAFAEPPYYDPAAIQGERVVTGAFSLKPAPELPTGRTRVVTLHLLVPEGAIEGYDLKLTAAAGPAGERIDATVSIAKGSE